MDLFLIHIMYIKPYIIWAVKNVHDNAKDEANENKECSFALHNLWRNGAALEN